MAQTCFRLGSLVLLLAASVPGAFAVQVTYTLTGYIQATGGGQQVNTSFTWTVLADTTGITPESPAAFAGATSTKCCPTS